MLVTSRGHALGKERPPGLCTTRHAGGLGTEATGRRRHRARARRAGAATAAAGLALLTAACGSGTSSPGSGASPSAGGATQSPSIVAFSQCMRSHGVPDWPDPGSNAPHGSTPQQLAQELGVSVSQLQAAGHACKSLNPKGNAPARQPLTAQEQQDYLRAAACMRAHGVPDFPDPSFSGGQVSFSIPSSINTSSPQVIQAVQTCRKLIPAGLPYSGTD